MAAPAPISPFHPTRPPQGPLFQIRLAHAPRVRASPPLLTRQERPSADPGSVAIPKQGDEAQTDSDRCICCAACGERLSHSRHAISIAAAHEHTFINPQGYLFRIRCYAAVENVSSVGKPSREFTWFPGHAWTILICSRCSQHVGWQFDAEASRFYALIVSAIAD